MSYNHKDKVGNQGDLIKHFALCCALHHYPLDRDQFSYLDVHAGRADYMLRNNGAWTRGIGAFAQLYASSASTDQELDYFYRLLSLDKTAVDTRYPGSSAIVHRVLQDRPVTDINLHLCDTDPGVCASLQQSYQTIDHVQVYCEDGYCKARQLTGINLVFIDPPNMDDHFHDYLALIRYCLQQGQPFIAWNSLHGNTAGNHMSARCGAISELARNSGTAQIAVRWQTAWQNRMCGCQMLFSLQQGDKLISSCQSLARLMQWETTT